jgi:PEP-CTERM motif
MNSGSKLFPASPFRLVATPAVALAAVLLAAPSKASADMITVESSSAVTFLDSGSSTTDFPAPFTPAQFAAAQTGSAASVLTSTPSYFPASDVPGALWIGTNANAGTGTGNTALYAISFSLPSAVSAASLTLTYGVDNALGDTNAGIYINETALPNSTGIPCGPGVACLGAFESVNTYTDASIGSLLASGTNTLFFDDVNLGGPAGLIFSANITFTPSGPTTTPEPSSLLLFGAPLALIGIGLRKRFVSPVG